MGYAGQRSDGVERRWLSLRFAGLRSKPLKRMQLLSVHTGGNGSSIPPPPPESSIYYEAWLEDVESQMHDKFTAAQKAYAVADDWSAWGPPGRNDVSRTQDPADGLDRSGRP